MVNVKAGKILSIFSIIYGILNIFANILRNDSFSGGINIFRTSLCIGLIILGIMPMKRLNKDLEIKRLVKILLIVWFLTIFGTLLVM